MDLADCVDQALPQGHVACGVLHGFRVTHVAVSAKGPLQLDFTAQIGLATGCGVVALAEKLVTGAEVPGQVGQIAAAARAPVTKSNPICARISGLSPNSGRADTPSTTTGAAEAHAARAVANDELAAFVAHGNGHVACDSASVARHDFAKLGCAGGRRKFSRKSDAVALTVAAARGGRRSRGRHGTVFSNFFRLVTVAALGTPGLFFKAPRGGLAHLQRRLGSRPRADIRRNFKGLAGLQHRRTLGRHRQDIAERRPVDAVALVVVLGL